MWNPRPEPGGGWRRGGGAENGLEEAIGTRDRGGSRPFRPAFSAFRSSDWADMPGTRRGGAGRVVQDHGCPNSREEWRCSMFEATPSQGVRLGVTSWAVSGIFLMIVAGPTATPCIAQGFGHGVPAMPPPMPHLASPPVVRHFTLSPSIRHFAPSSTGHRPSVRPPLSSGGPSQQAMAGRFRKSSTGAFATTWPSGRCFGTRWPVSGPSRIGRTKTVSISRASESSRTRSMVCADPGT